MVVCTTKANRKSVPVSCSNALSPKVRRRLCVAVRSNASLERWDLVGWYQQSRSWIPRQKYLLCMHQGSDGSPSEPIICIPTDLLTHPVVHICRYFAPFPIGASVGPALQYNTKSKRSTRTSVSGDQRNASRQSVLLDTHNDVKGMSTLAS